MNDFPSITENEWFIMRVVWANPGCTTADIVKGLAEDKNITSRTIRVMISRLVKKGAIEYEVDPNNSTIFHYKAKYSEGECRNVKCEQFKDAFFSGNGSLMLATMIKQQELLEEERIALIEMLEGGCQ